MLGEHEDIDSDGGAEEEIRGEGNDALDVIVIDQVLADFLLRSATVEDAGEADDGGAAFRGQVAEGVEDEGKIGLGLGGEHPGGGEAVVVDEGGIVAADPFDRVGWIGDDGIEGFFVVVLGIEEGVAELDVELVVVHVVQEHVHPRQVVGGVVDFLAEESLFDDVVVELLFRLQEEGAGAAGGVVDFVDAGLAVDGQAGDEAGDALRGEELATGFSGIGGVVGDEELVGIAEEIDLVAREVAEVEPADTGEDGGEAGVLGFHGVSEPIAGGVEVGEEALDVLFRGVAAGGGLDGGKDGGEVGI